MVSNQNDAQFMYKGSLEIQTNLLDYRLKEQHQISNYKNIGTDSVTWGSMAAFNSFNPESWLMVDTNNLLDIRLLDNSYYTKIKFYIKDEAFIACIPKQTPIDNSDHYFLFGRKEAKAIKGLWLGSADYGHFLMEFGHKIAELLLTYQSQNLQEEWVIEDADIVLESYHVNYLAEKKSLFNHESYTAVDKLVLQLTTDPAKPRSIESMSVYPENHNRLPKENLCVDIENVKNVDCRLVI
jgi:hypothetical protein